MKNQKGFSAVIVLLSVLVVTAIGFTGYYVWNTQQDNKEAPVATVAGSQEQAPTVSTDNNSNIEYTELPTLGIKLVKNEQSKKFVFDQNDQSVIVRSNNLAEAMDTVCMQDHGGNGILAVVSKEQKDPLGNTEGPVTVKTIKQFDNAYLVISRSPGGGNGWVCGSQGAESFPSSLQKTIDQLTTELEDVLQNSTKL